MRNSRVARFAALTTIRFFLVGVTGAAPLLSASANAASNAAAMALTPSGVPSIFAMRMRTTSTA